MGHDMFNVTCLTMIAASLYFGSFLIYCYMLGDGFIIVTCGVMIDILAMIAVVLYSGPLLFYCYMWGLDDQYCFNVSLTYNFLIVNDGP